MTRSTAIITDDSVGDVGFVRALPSFVGRGAAVGTAGTEFAFTEGAVQHGQFAQLHFAEIVLVFGNLDSLFDDLLNLLKNEN